MSKPTLSAEPVRSPAHLTFRRLLVPYDGSPLAKAALDVALAFAHDGSEIFIVNVVDELAVIWPSADRCVCVAGMPLLDTLDSDVRALLRGARERAKSESVEVVTDLVYGKTVSSINETVEACQCDLIVMGTHARLTFPGVFLGGTTDGILRSATVPVLTVRDDGASHAVAFSRVLFAIDTSLAAMAARRVAERLSVERHAKLIAYTAPDGVVPGPAIVRAAASSNAGLVVMGTHGRKSFDRLVLGSVAEFVVRNSEVPVLVVRG